jgi:hypothetical protein
MIFKPETIVPVIEEYRNAYMAYKHPRLYESSGYKPQVSYAKIQQSKGLLYTASLADTWVHIDKYRRFRLANEPVDGGSFSSEHLQMALEELLNFTRIQFMDDALFNKIKI